MNFVVWTPQTVRNESARELRRFGDAPAGSNDATSSPRGIEQPLQVYKRVIEPRCVHASSKYDAFYRPWPKVVESDLRVSMSAEVPVLGKELAPGAQSFRELQTQSDVNSDRTHGKLLVDDPKHSNNMHLWNEILCFRCRMDGFEGVWAVWEGMKRRQVILSTSGEDAEALWRTFCNASITAAKKTGTASTKLMSQVIGQARSTKQGTGEHFAGLYTCIVGRWLRNQPLKALAWHDELTSSGLFTREDLVKIVPDTVLSASRERAIHVFSVIYLKSDLRDQYDACIGKALEVVDAAGALRLHQLFLRNGDGPSSAMFARSDVQLLFDLDGNAHLPMIHSKRADHGSTSSAAERNFEQTSYVPLRRAAMNTVVGDVHGIKEKQISDHFCARMFATRAFSINFVIKSLSFFGVDKLGPMAFREMAFRSANPEAFSVSLKSLEAAGIGKSDSVYTRILIKLAKDGESGLWNIVLGSDQHPEAYEDVKTQKSLLASFLNERKWSQAHVCLLALWILGAESSAQAWNLLLEYYTRTKQYRPMLSCVQSMQNQGMNISGASTDLMFQEILPKRQRGKRVVKGTGPMFFDPLNFVTNTHIYAAEHGLSRCYTTWQELLKRFGMDHRFEEVERLTLWLVDHYSSRKPAGSLSLNLSRISGRQRTRNDARTLHMIFSPNMLKALFTWGFRSASVRGRLSVSPAEAQSTVRAIHVEEWARGLALLYQLRSRHLSHHAVLQDLARDAFTTRMWILFGPGVSLLPINREAQRVNQLDLAHYIRHANAVWPGLVDWVDADLLMPASEIDRRLLPAFFNTIKRTSWKRREYADVENWAKQLATSDLRYAHHSRSITARNQAWLSSRLRLQLPSPTGIGTKSQRKAFENTSLNTLARTKALPSSTDSSALQADAINQPDVLINRPDQTRQQPAAHSKNSHPPPNQQYTPEPL